MQLLAVKEGADGFDRSDLFVRDRKDILVKYYEAGTLADFNGADLIQQAHAFGVLPGKGMDAFLQGELSSFRR